MSRFHVDPNERVPIYEFDTQVTISDTPPNVIWIRARMTVEIAGRVGSELMKLGADNKPEAHLGAHTGALLLHNILAWSGPDFDGLPCTPENIRALPTGDPFIEKVTNEIGERNKARTSPNAKSATTNGSTSAGAADWTPNTSGAKPSHESRESLSLQLATGIPRSPLLRAMAGHQSRSDD